MAVSYNPTDYLYLSARLRAKESGLVGKEDLARYASMKDAAEITAALVAEGKFPADTPREQALLEMLGQGFDTVREGAPDPGIFAFLQYPYDAHNVKTVLKCYFARRCADALLLDVGTVPVGELAQIPTSVPEALPTHLREAVARAREVYERTGDPREIDFILDAACFADMAEAAKALPAAEKLVRARAEMTNLRTARRVLAMGGGVQGEQILAHAFLEGGVSEKQELLAAFCEGREALDALIAKTAFAKAFESDDPAVIDREIDNVYVQIAREVARVPFGAEVAIGYLVGVEYAVKNLRILLVAKETGADAAELGGRLRENYV